MSTDDQPSFLEEFAGPRDDPWAQANRLAAGAAEERRVSEEARSAQAALVDRRLFALRDQVEILHRNQKTANESIGAVQTTIDSMAADMTKNTQMTQQILGMISGGKMIVAVIKFCGAMAIPISAVVALWHLLWPHGVGK